MEPVTILVLCASFGSLFGAIGVRGVYNMVVDGPLENTKRKEVIVPLPSGGFAIKKEPYKHPLGDEINNDDFWDDVQYRKTQTFKGFTNGADIGQESGSGGSVQDAVQQGTGPAKQVTYNYHEEFEELMGADGRITIILRPSTKALRVKQQIDLLKERTMRGHHHTDFSAAEDFTTVTRADGTSRVINRQGTIPEIRSIV